MATIQYYLNEEKNTILVSGSSTKAGMNALLTSSKDPSANFDPNLTSKISSLGMNTTYVVQNGIDTTSIDITNNQELWVYRGYNQDGGTDGETYRYNPHLHRPYKAYILTETGSGTPAFPYSPTGSDINTNAQSSTGGDIAGKFLEKQLSIVGNTSAAISSSADSGSFTVFDSGRGVHPFVFTKYHTLTSPPAVGAAYYVYQENVTYADVGTTQFNTAVGDANPGQGKVSFNSATVQSISEVYLNKNQANSEKLGPLSQSIENGKTGGTFRVDNGNNIEFIQFTIDTIDNETDYWKLNVSSPQTSNPFTLFGNNSLVDPSIVNFPDLATIIDQSQGVTPNITPYTNDNIAFETGSYSFTSSTFTQEGFNGSAASGSSQFGLYTDYDFYVGYNAVNESTNTIRVFFTGSGGSFDSRFFDLPADRQATFVGIVGSTSASDANGDSANSSRFNDGTYVGSRFNVEINNPSRPGTTPSNVFSTRWNDTYISFSQSLSESIDGLYIFNQIPQNDIQVTASVLLAAWTGSDSGSKYGTADYGTGEYGEGETGEGPTWQTASLRIYTGSYPTSVPNTTDAFLTESIYSSAFIHTQSQGVPVTFSFSIPSESIAIKDCLSMALHVSSGSFNSASVENSLVVRNYNLEFFTPTQSGQGDGRVPTFIENAFSGTLGFSNTVDCQPLYANVTSERINNRIQIVEPQPTSSGFGGFHPLNFFPILSGSAQKSTIPESYYTTFRHINPRYLGSRTTANDVNTIDGLGGQDLLTRDDGSEYGFGTLPVIDYQTAYFAYCDQVIDPYPVVNNVTQFNLKYLINDSGDALQPNLSPYTAFDVEGTWTEGEGARVGIAQISGSSQYDQLNGLNPVKYVAKEPVAVLWSQTGANTYAGSDVNGSIPLAGQPGVVSTYTASFLSYNMSANGRNFETNNQNDKNIPITNALTQSSTAGLFTFNTASRYGEVNSSTINQASSSIVSSESPAPNGGAVGGTATYAGVGEMYFNQDYFAINDSGDTPPGYDYLTGDDLSDVYSFTAQFEFPSTMPQEYRTDAGGTWDKSDYNRTNVGFMFVKLQYTDTSGTTDSGWIDMPMVQVERPIFRGYFGNNQTIDIDLINALGSSNAGLRNSNKQMYVQINPTAFRNAYNQAGIEKNTAQYGSFIFNLASSVNTTIRADRRYRWVYRQYYNNENVDADRNYWNPNIRPQNLGSGVTPSAAYNGPYISAKVVSENGVSTQIDGALNAPYWAFSQSAGSDVRDHIQLSSSNGNVAYGGEYYQQYIPYTASDNPQFPGGLEPVDTSIPSYNVPWVVNVGDEIKFQNNETQTYTILNIVPPQDTADNKLVLTLDRAVPASINKDFFILRRYRYSPNTVILNSLFPYGGLKTDRVEVDDTLTTGVTKFFDANGDPVANGDTVFTQSMSSTSSIEPRFAYIERALAKSDNTPSGILFPEYPTALIELEPDKVITDLRDKKLIT